MIFSTLSQIGVASRLPLDAFLTAALGVAGPQVSRKRQRSGAVELSVF